MLEPFKFSRQSRQALIYRHQIKSFTTGLALFFLAVLCGLADPVINEFLASNTSVHPDNSDFDDYSDWIELYNPESTDFSLENHYLTDDLEQPFKWKIPGDAVIPAGGYLVIRADGYDAGPGESHIRGFYPWGSTFLTRWYHTNFKLSAEGEAIGLFRNTNPSEDLILIGSDAAWKYRDMGTNPGSEWMMVDYADDSWSEGAAKLGYGEGDENTIVGFGPDAAEKFPTTHFRHHFMVTDPARIDDLRLRVLVDDGAVFYMNGVEFARIRMGSGTVDYLDFAVSSVPSASEGIIETIIVDRTLLQAGENVLTAEVHQHSKTSSDLSFSAELIGRRVVVNSLVPLDAVWKYNDTGVDPGQDWMKPTYLDLDWAQGPAELGYGDGDEATVVSYGPDGNDKYPTTYFRHHFSLTDPSILSDIEFRILADDGAIVYLNGKEIGRIRMDPSSNSYRDYANALGEEGVFDTIDFPGSMLVEGDNLIAVEIHQYRNASSDISFNAELKATEVSGTSVLIDSIEYSSQISDVSYGRSVIDTGKWSFFGEPTPGSANTTESLSQFESAPAVISSLESGFYTGTQTLEMVTSIPNGIIRYTMDGSVPTSDSSRYTEVLSLDSTTIVRARLFVPGAIPGPILTRTYLFNEPERTLPVVSVVADPITLFDDSIGIYENETEYPFKGREIPVRLEFFEPDQDLGFSVSAGMKIGGENIWRSAQKPLNITMRGKYGDDAINYQVFPGEPVGSFDKIQFRNGGDNWRNAMLRDAMIPSILGGQSENGLSSYRPCVLFLNGEYWGIYNIRKRMDESYFANEHHLAEGDYDLVLYAHDEAGDVSLLADIGSTDSYRNFIEFFKHTDLSDPAAYTIMESMMNVDSFIDSIVTIDFSANTSWRHNREFWSARASGSKWQWNITDLDRGFNEANAHRSLINDFSVGYPLFDALIDNQDFVNRLLQRYAAHIGSTFHPDRVALILDGLSSELDAEMPRHIARWRSEGGIQSLASRQNQLDEIKRFVTNRPAIALEQLEQALGLSRGMAELTVTCIPANGGQVSIAGIPMTPEFSETVALFKNTPVRLTATPAPGYAFSGWSNGSEDPTIEISLIAAQTITANYQAGAETVLSGSLSSSRNLTAAGSPYSVQGDLIVEAGSTLTISSGVHLLMSEASSIYVYGSLQVNGTQEAPVFFRARGDYEWGNLSFVEASGTSHLSYLNIRGATQSWLDPVNLKAAVSSYNSGLELDNVDIEAPLPVFCRYGSTVIRNSNVSPSFTGDGINIKSGVGVVENCTFTGNEFPDTDAIDFDDVVNGVIRGNRIYAFRGYNSDAIDIGEGSQDLLVVDNRIFNITDKGVSVGQASTVRIEGNLIVDCNMGVGVKDEGSTAYIDQNTFSGVDIGVASYEKNVGKGGGAAFVTNCIFSRSRDKPVHVDSLSRITVNYSLSDTISLSGIGNLKGDPLFADSGSYDFSLLLESPAINSGDPAHPYDSDGSRSDMGAYYSYEELDYPFLIPNVIVINEVLAHSHDSAPDWIELYNNSSTDMDLGGWFLSDDPDEPEKFRIESGTIIPARGYLVLYEDLDFGSESGNPGAFIPFALSENGDVVSVFGPSDGLRPDYHETESFGASLTGVTMGRIYKSSTRTYNFVSMDHPTPGAANSDPSTGPVVISEIMYHPERADSEYLVLVNISKDIVFLYDFETGEPWRMTDGIIYDFSMDDPVSLQPGERIILTRNRMAFIEEFAPPEGIRVFQWSSGGLSNGGETVQLSRPGDVDDLGERHYIRVDRVKYSDEMPWPKSPDGEGDALVRIDKQAYGNDVANWVAMPPIAGRTAFQSWAQQQMLPPGADGLTDDPDGDHLSNLEEYAFSTNAMEPETEEQWMPAMLRDGSKLYFSMPGQLPDIEYVIQFATDLTVGDWTDLESSVESQTDQTVLVGVSLPELPSKRFYRLVIYYSGL